MEQYPLSQQRKNNSHKTKKRYNDTNTYNESFKL